MDRPHPATLAEPLLQRERDRARHGLSPAADARIRQLLRERAHCAHAVDARTHGTLLGLCLATAVFLGGLTPWKTAQCQFVQAPQGCEACSTHSR